VEPCRDLLQQSLTRLSNRLFELSAWRDRETIFLADGEFRDRLDAPWIGIKPGDHWPTRATPVEIRFAGLVPTRWAGLPVRCRFHLGGEALLFVNDHAVGGLNSFQSEHPVLESAIGGETLRFRTEVVPHGLFGTPTTQPKIELACILVPDNDVRPLYEDLAAALEAARYHVSNGRKPIAACLIDAVQHAFSRIALPRGETVEYLARIAAISQGRASGSYYGNQESLESLWENWTFRSPTDSLTPEDRNSFRDAGKRLADDIELIRAKFPTEGGVWLTGHAHIDLAWLWPLEETQRKAQRTFQNVISLMGRYPEFRFNQSSAQLYAWVEQSNAPLFAKVRERIRNGSWEIVGGMWVEPDGNLPSGESWVRQLLFGQRYFENRFDNRAKVAWIPDSFGFAGNLPQLFKSAGMPFFFTHKLTWNERNPFPYDLYWWQGIDGSRVLAHSFSNPENGYNSRLTVREVAETWQNFDSKRKHDYTLLAFGYGDGGGGPSSDMLERFLRLREFPGLPHLRMGSVTEFYENIDTQSLPIWVGEQYLEFHRATFTTQGKVKSLHRALEHALVESETAATLASLWRQAAYPKDALDRIWKILLLNEFHDILPGSSVHSVYQAAHAQLATAISESAQIRTNALTNGTVSEDPPAGADSQGLVWNLDIYDRPLVVEIPAPANDAIQDSTCDRCEASIQRLDENCILIMAEETVVPALGAVHMSVAQGANRKVSSPVLTSHDSMENEFLRIQVREDGTLASIYDKEYRREVFADRGNQLWLYTDIPRQFDAWDIDASYADEGIELLAGAAPAVIENGPLRAALRTTRSHEGIEIVQTYRLRRLSRVLEVHNAVHWRGRRRLLRALFPLAVQTHEMWAETAFGAVARSNNRNTPWDQARFEVPAHRWVDLSEPNYGVSLLNNGKYGHSAHGNLLGVSLLRSPIYPDPYADEGDHEFVYAVYPHPDTWRSGTVRVAKELHTPLRYVAGGAGPVPSSLLRLSGSALELACLKRAEESETVIARLYEPHGNRGDAVLESGRKLERVSIVNILEEEVAELPIKDGKEIKISVTPFQVLTLRLTFRIMGRRHGPLSPALIQTP
jgi:alpha-mannosidase